MLFASPRRLSTRINPAAPARRARSAFEAKVQCPREASAIIPVSEPAASGVMSGLFGSSTEPQMRRSTAVPPLDVSVPTSISGCGEEATVGGNSLAWITSIGIRRSWSGADAPWTLRTGEKTWVFDEAATVIAAGAVPGEPTVPRPMSSRSFPAAITGTTPAAATFRTTSIIASFAGSDSEPPPEKLITSIPSRTANSNAAAISGVLATWPSGVGMLKTR
jgi:hypothetical protein